MGTIRVINIFDKILIQEGSKTSNIYIKENVTVEGLSGKVIVKNNEIEVLSALPGDFLIPQEDSLFDLIQILNGIVNSIEVPELTLDELVAIQNANSPTGLNPFATMNDVSDHGLPDVLTANNTTGVNDISIDTGQVIKATTGSSVLQLKQGDSFIQDGAFGVDDVSLFSLSTVASCLALLKSNFTKVGQFCVYNNDASDVNTGGVVNYPCASASQNWTIKQNVTNVLTSSGKNGIAKTDDSLYCNQLAYNTGLAGELTVNHTPSATDYTQTHQDDDGIIALTKDIPKAFFAVNLDSAESSVVRVFAGGRTTFTVTHNLNTLDLKPEVFRLSDGRTMGWRTERTGVNTVEVSRTGNVANGLFRILI